MPFSHLVLVDLPSQRCLQTLRQLSELPKQREVLLHDVKTLICVCLSLLCEATFIILMVCES